LLTKNYTTTDYNQFCSLIEMRVIEGGHDIEPHVIERRYHKGIKNLFDIYLPIVDGDFNL
jgi:predicted ABC-type ATPase